MALKAPIAKKVPKELSIHDDVRVDNYYWLNDREDQEVIDYLEAENSFYAENTAHTKDFQEFLFQEMKARIKEDDASVPYKLNGYYYITRFEIGKEYLIFASMGNIYSDNRNEELTTTICSNTGLVTEKQKEIEFIKKCG